MSATLLRLASWTIEDSVLRAAATAPIARPPSIPTKRMTARVVPHCRASVTRVRYHTTERTSLMARERSAISPFPECGLRSLDVRGGEPHEAPGTNTPPRVDVDCATSRSSDVSDGTDRGSATARVGLGGGLLRIVMVKELVSREVVALIDARVVLGAELVLDAVHLVLVASEAVATLDPAVLSPHDRDEPTHDRHFTNI